jgi:hypothetical protein
MEQVVFTPFLTGFCILPLQSFPLGGFISSSSITGRVISKVKHFTSSRRKEYYRGSIWHFTVIYSALSTFFTGMLG